METKLCFRCKNELPIDKFSKCKRNKDGLKSICKGCKHQDYLNHISTYREYAARNKDVKSAYNKEYKANRKEEIAEYNKKYYKQHVDAILARNKIYAKQKADILRAKRKVYRLSNKEMLQKKRSDSYYRNIEIEKARMKKYKLCNKESFVVRQQKRDAKKKKLDSTLTLSQWESIKEYFGESCAYCGKQLPLEQEHFIPVTKNGEYTHNNIIPACKSCNCSKNNKDFFEWYPEFKYYSKKREKFILDYLGYKNGIQQLALM